MTQSTTFPARLFYKLHIPDNCIPDLAPIVLLHGLCTTHQTWLKLAPSLAEMTRRSVIMVDLRNHGDSEWNKDHSLNVMIADVKHLLEKLDYSKYIVVGHSVGGRVACGLAFNMDKVELLIVEDATLTKPVDNFDHKKFLKSLFKMIHFIPKRCTEKEMQHMMGKYLKQVMPEFQIQIDEAAFMVPVHKDLNGKFQFDFNADAMEKWLDDETQYLIDLENCSPYTGPALFLHGDKSPTPVSEDESIRIYIPNAEFADVSNSMHTPHLESADHFLELVCDFIKRNSESKHIL